MAGQDFTAAQAGDPTTPAQTLADIAAQRPDLRPAVAANPAAYPGLVEWLGSLGEPEVDAALAARAAAVAQEPAAQAEPVTQAEPVVEQPTEVLHPEQPTQVIPTGAAPPAPSWASHETQPQAPAAPAYEAPAAPAYEAPSAPAYDAPTAAYPPATAAYPPPTAAYPPGGYPAQTPSFPPPGGMPPGQAYGYAPPPAKKSGNKALTIVLIVLGVLVLLGVGAFFAVKSLVNRVSEELETALPEVTDILETDGSYGDDPALDALWDACEAEDWQACDDLYMQAPLGSEYESFGDTCGNRTDGTSMCVDEYADPIEEPTEEPTEPSGDAQSYGDDAYYDSLWDMCAAGDPFSCDELYLTSPVGSDYEAFGDTCGETTAGGTYCGTAELYGGPYAPGDDAALDALWGSCEAGDMVACDSLYEQSGSGTIYETLGDTCGGQQGIGTQLWCDPARN